MKITDGKETIGIELREWIEGTGYGPDYADDYFGVDVAGLPSDDLTGAYIVDDLDRWIDAAKSHEVDGGCYGSDSMECLTTSLKYAGYFLSGDISGKEYGSLTARQIVNKLWDGDDIGPETWYGSVTAAANTISWSTTIDNTGDTFHIGTAVLLEYDGGTDKIKILDYDLNKEEI